MGFSRCPTRERNSPKLRKQVVSSASLPNANVPIGTPWVLSPTGSIAPKCEGIYEQPRQGSALRIYLSTNYTPSDPSIPIVTMISQRGLNVPQIPTDLSTPNRGTACSSESGAFDTKDIRLVLITLCFWFELLHLTRNLSQSRRCADLGSGRCREGAAEMQI